jgi:hypothetical protein
MFFNPTVIEEIKHYRAESIRKRRYRKFEKIEPEPKPFVFHTYAFKLLYKSTCNLIASDNPDHRRILNNVLSLQRLYNKIDRSNFSDSENSILKSFFQEHS